MNVYLYTAPTIEPISLDDLRLHLRLNPSQLDEEEYLEDLIKGARRRVENLLQRQLLTATWDYYLQDWPAEEWFYLPYGNLQSVTSIAWKDQDGTTTTMTVTTDYLVETNGEGLGRIVLPDDADWPTTELYPSNPIKTRFVCGWTAAAAIPYQIRAAIKMIAADLYLNRSSQELFPTGQGYQVNKTVEALLNEYAIWQEFLK